MLIIKDVLIMKALLDLLADGQVRLELECRAEIWALGLDFVLEARIWAMRPGLRPYG